MKTTTSSRLKLLSAAAAVVFLAAVFSWNTYQNATHEDYHNSNFSKFWIAGHMVLTGQNPYDPTQWYNAHIQLGATWIPDKIFLYPLPQAFLLVPLALLPPQASFLFWGILSQTILAITCFVLLNQPGWIRQKRLFVPLVIFFLFFGPVYLSLQIGSIGAIAMAALLVAIILLEQNKSLPAGLALSLLALKPPQGFPILFLAGIWFLFRRDWKAIAGMILGGLILLIGGLIYDPLWIQKFLNNSESILGRTLGVQSNLWSLSYLACNANGTCTAILGGVLFVGLITAGGWFVWRFRSQLTAWETFSIIIPIAFVCAVYLFAYDQMLFIFPIVWIAAKLVERTKSYVPSLLFMIGLDVLSIALLVVQANTKSDVWNISITIIVLGLCFWLLRVDKRSLEQLNRL